MHAIHGNCLEHGGFLLFFDSNPKEGMIGQPVIGAETMLAVNYPCIELDKLNTPVLSLKAPFMEEVAKEIENSDRLIEIVDVNQGKGCEWMVVHLNKISE
jgi:hypothetical protein